MVGTTNVTGLFFPMMTILTSHEDKRALTEIYSFVHFERIHLRLRMGDGAPAITKAEEEVFGYIPIQSRLQTCNKVNVLEPCASEYHTKNEINRIH